MLSCHVAFMPGIAKFRRSHSRVHSAYVCVSMILPVPEKWGPVGMPCAGANPVSTPHTDGTSVMLQCDAVSHRDEFDCPWRQLGGHGPDHVPAPGIEFVAVIEYFG